MTSIEIIWTDEQTHHTIWAQVQFFFLDLRTLKFLKMKCIQQIKNCRLTDKKDNELANLLNLFNVF